MRSFDSHSHIYEARFDDDREAVYARMREAGVATIAVGTCLATSTQAVAVATSEPDIVYGATIGVHPTDTQESFNAVQFEALLSEAVVGVGECGFDYFRTPRDEAYTRQREVFEAQVQFAVDHDLPLMLHIRPSEGSDDAHRDALEVIDLYQKEYGDTVRGNVHFFTSTKEIAREYVSRGFTIAFPGVVTFAPELADVVRDVPLDMLLVETDAPYAAPVPHRGTRNEPVYVNDVIRYIADIRNEDVEVVRAATVTTAQEVFKKSC